MTHWPLELQRACLTSFETAQVPHRFTDVLVLGTGVAGLSAAIAAANHGKTDVLLVAKSEFNETATRYAQGGIAAVLEPERTGDSIATHINDTLATAAGLGNEEMIQAVVTEGVARVRELTTAGARWDKDSGGAIHYTLEGGHSCSRILHVGDSTGVEIQRVLTAAAFSQPCITPLENTFAVDLITSNDSVCGAILRPPHGSLEIVWAKRTILATGGMGRLFRETTNPSVATGDGVAMAFRAGAILQDLEFVQFHPTTLYLAGADRFLITEAVRGEGAYLVDGNGRRFMERFDPRAELAPRDVVSRAITQVMNETGESQVFLDLSPIPPSKIRERFPCILEKLKGFGIDILKETIPVRPSAHYSIGGVRTDLHGRTSVHGLFAAGEVAATALHGANRLASNSLLDGLVLGQHAGLAASAEANEVNLPAIASVAPSPELAPEDDIRLDLDDLTTSLRSLLWRNVGLERNATRLEAAQRQIETWLPYVLGRSFDDPRGWTLQNMLLVSHLVTVSALRREESRGVHFRSDFPEPRDDRFRHHLTLSRTGVGKSAVRQQKTNA